MKKTLFSLTLIAFCAYGAVAQGISGGLKVGANFANMKWDSDFGNFSPDSRTAFHFGAYLNVGFSETFSLQPELLYNSVGAKMDDEALKANYLSVPIMFKYNPVPVFNIHAGPQVGFLMSAKAEDEDVKEMYKGLDLGLGVGIGADLPMGLGISARYVLGLANIADTDVDIDEVDFTVKNNVVQISVTYKLFGGN